MTIMDYEAIRLLIEANKEKVNFGEFGHGISNDWVEKAESRLGVKFPSSYIWWLKNYNGGEINGEEVFSIYELDFDTVVGGDIVYINELNKKNGFSNSKQLVIQENDQGEIYYFDLNQVTSEGENPVYIDTTGEKYANDFLHFLAKKIEE